MKPLHSPGSFLTHIVFKIIVMLMFEFEEVFDALAGALIARQVMIVLIIVDFWFTKNVNGRKLLGLRWYFGQDQHGFQRLMFETRINEQFISSINSKLFWIVQVGYLTVPYVDLITTIVIFPFMVKVDFFKTFINLCIISGGTLNLLLFYIAASRAGDKILQLKKMYGNQFVKKMGPNSVISFA